MKSRHLTNWSWNNVFDNPLKSCEFVVVCKTWLYTVDVWPNDSNLTTKLGLASSSVAKLRIMVLHSYEINLINFSSTLFRFLPTYLLETSTLPYSLSSFFAEFHIRLAWTVRHLIVLAMLRTVPLRTLNCVSANKRISESINTSNH